MDSNHRCLDVGQESLPLDHGTIAVTKGRVELPCRLRLDGLNVACLPVPPLGQSVARVGIEPTNDHQGLSLAALPVCVPCQFRGLESNQHQRLQRPMSYRLDDPGIAEGEGVEPSRLIARPFSGRLPSPIGLPFRSIGIRGTRTLTTLVKSQVCCR
jgi:hypothetical protein